MWQYEVDVRWTGYKCGEVSAEENDRLQIGTPPDFGGPEGKWSPEQLLAGTVASCILTTSLYFLNKVDIELKSYDTKATAALEKGMGGLTFTGISVCIEMVIDGTEANRKVAEQALQKAEAACPVSDALRCPVEVRRTVECIR